MLIKKFQSGGQMPAGQVQPAPEQTVQDPLMELYQLAVQALQTQDCQAAMGVCQGFIMIVQQAQNGAGEVDFYRLKLTLNQREPVFKKGGKMKRKGGCKK